MVDIPIHFASTEPAMHQLTEVVVAAMRRLGVPGVAVGIRHGDHSYLAGYGVTSMENPLPVTADTLFQIGSTTKTVTGTLVMRLVEMGLIDLDEPVRTYIPDLRLSSPEAEAIVTTRHLVAHMAGWGGDYFSDTGSGDDCLARYVAELAELPQLVPPGTLWAYNNAGFGLAGRVIEVVTGKAYEEAAHEMVLAPIGLDNSFFYPADVISRRFVVGHRRDENQDPQVLRPWAVSRATNPIGGLCSSARDQLRYAAFHLGDGSLADGTQLLREETMREMQTIHYPANLGRQMGLSWILKEIDGARIVLHGGATAGQQSAFMMVPSEKFAVTVLTNAEEGSMLHETVTNWALDHFLGLREAKPAFLELSRDEVEPYLGTYEAQMTHIELFYEEEHLMMRSIPQGGFPDKNSPAPPAPPPSHLAFFEPHRAIALDPPLANTKIEFLRDEAGRIVWLRTSRLHRRV